MTKRILCVLLVAVMVFSIAGCGDKDKTKDGIRSITWLSEIDGGGNDAMWDTCEPLKQVVKNTGIRPTIVANGGSEKLNLLIATDDLPDLMTFVSNNSTFNDLIENDMLYTMQDIVKEFEPKLKDEIPEVIWNQAKNRDDGLLYGLPSMFQDIDPDGKYSGTQGYNVRADIYEELGSPDMTTPDGFINALKAFKEKYPTIDGKKTIPLDLNMQCWGLYILERSFGIIDNFYYDEEADLVKVKWRDPKYRELVKFMARLTREGLLDKDMYVKQANQITEDRATGVTFCIASSFDQLWDVSSVLKRTNDKAFYKMVEPMRVVENPIFQPVVPYSYWTMTTIPKSAKNPDTAAEFLRYMWSKEGNLLMNWGIEGEHYYVTEEGYIRKTDSALEAQANNADGFMKETGIQAFRFLYRGKPLIDTGNFSTEEPNRAADRKLASKYAKVIDTNLTRFLEPTKKELDIQNVKANMDRVVSSTIHKYTLEGDEEKALKALDDMLKEFDKLGVDKLEKWRTEQYKNNIKLYGEYKE